MTDHSSSSSMRPRAVPVGRFARMARLGGLASSVVGTAAVGGARAVMRGERPAAADLFLTPASMGRIADRLSEMRGAAMKLGQLLSMETGDFLSPELSDILARLRANADTMPPAQLKSVLEATYGADFRKDFQSFDTRPLAAASIGQVHRATTQDGMRLAIKLQYPGVREAIDSDLDNVAGLIRWSGLWPSELDIQPLMAEARRQLHEEADYEREARYLDQFSQLLADDPRFVVPALYPALSTQDALAMSYEPAEPIETLAEADPCVRDAAMEALIELCLKELFQFRVMQTDPNFANYRWRADTKQIVLLDFGASRQISDDLADGHLRLLRAGLDGQRSDIYCILQDIGFIKDGLSDAHREAILDMAELGFGPLRGGDPYDFATATLDKELRARGQVIGQDRDLWHIPPAETLFLQRKIGGLYLLASRIGARVNIAKLAQEAAR